MPKRRKDHARGRLTVQSLKSCPFCTSKTFVFEPGRKPRLWCRKCGRILAR